MRERALRFGRSANLVGILTEPDGGSAPGLPAAVFLNSGILHRVGASRLYVKFARSLAEQGFTSLRFDFSGVGDSEPRRDALPFEESAVIEASEAMDHLAATKGIERFFLVGLCSGSDVAYHTSLADARVVGVANLDAFVYRTWKYYLRHYGPRVFRLGVWRNSLGARLAALRGNDAEAQAPSASYVAPEYRRVFPPRAVIRDGLRKLSERDVRMFHFFSGGMEEHVNYESQYIDAFKPVDLRRLVDVIYVKDADHIVTGLEHQRLVVERLSDWAVRSFRSLARTRGETLQPVGADR